MNRRTFFCTASWAFAPLAVSAINDPLNNAINAYRTERIAIMALPESLLGTTQIEAEYVETYWHNMREIIHEPPETKSLVGGERGDTNNLRGRSSG